MDIFNELDKSINFEAVGSNCGNVYCINSSHFMSLGVIPALSTPSYMELRNRKCTDETEWFNPYLKEFLGGKLYDNNSEYSFMKMIWINNKQHLIRLPKKIKRRITKLIK